MCGSATWGRASMVSEQKVPAIREDRLVRRKPPVIEKAGAVIYCRVSTKDQLDGFSIETQEKQCRAYCLKQGYTVIELYQEARSAKGHSARPEFERMLKTCLRPHSEVGAVVVYAVSRFARSTADHTKVRESLRARNVRLLSVTEEFDDRTATGRWQENSLSVHAQYDNELRSERTTDGMMTAMSAGKWCHKAPIGYVNTETSGGLSFDPVRANLVRKAFELYGSQKYSKKAVLEMVTDQGLRTPRSGKPISRSSWVSWSICAASTSIRAAKPPFWPARISSACITIWARKTCSITFRTATGSTFRPAIRYARVSPAWPSPTATIFPTSGPSPSPQTINSNTSISAASPVRMRSTASRRQPSRLPISTTPSTIPSIPPAAGAFSSPRPSPAASWAAT